MPASSAASLFVKILDWIKTRATQDRELASLSHIERQLLAADIGITESELWAIMPAMSDHSELLDKMICARGLDPDLVRHIFVGATEDMEATCTRCHDVGVCRRELRAGTAARNSHAFCGNAEVIDELLGINV
jgi:Family of unknown function (DUF6455)